MDSTRLLEVSQYGGGGGGGLKIKSEVLLQFSSSFVCFALHTHGNYWGRGAQVPRQPLPPPHPSNGLVVSYC